MNTNGTNELDAYASAPEGASPHHVEPTLEQDEELTLSSPSLADDTDLEAWEPSAAAFGEGYAQVTAAKAIHRPTGKAAKEAKRRAAQRKAADEERKAAFQRSRSQDLHPQDDPQDGPEDATPLSPLVPNASAHLDLDGTVESLGREGSSAAGGETGSPASDPAPAAALRKRAGRKLAVAAGVGALCLVAAGAALGVNWYRTHPVSIVLDGQAVTVEGSQRTIQGLLDDGTIELSAGDYLAIDGSVLKKRGGKDDQLQLNGTAVEASAYDQLLNEGDELEVNRGEDVTEEFTVESQVRIPHTTTVTGWGAIHWYAQGNGRDGSKGVTTGKESGVVIDDVIEKPRNVKVVQYSANTRGKKVIALTFDDGPWPTTTEAVLDVLKKNKTKATFFTLGNQISGREHLIKRMYEEGHQICTHSYDHAAGSGQGVNITYMSRKEQRSEIIRGMEAISAVTGEDASTVVRLPGGNVNKRTMDILSDLVTAEINWDVDTLDWSRPGVKAIYQSIMSARGGDIVLLHDGGGDRTQTVRALKKALPALRQKGYEFVTMDQLIRDYPPEQS